MSDTHRLAPLLAPRSVALVGASPRPGSIGNDMIAVLRDNGFAGDIHLVNPKYDTIDGVPCRASIGAIGSSPDLAVLGVGTRQIEPTFDDALAAGAGAIVLFDGLFDKADAGPALRARLAAKAAQAGVPVLGGNGMGYYNFDARTHVSFQAPPDRKPGGISLIAHSGSVFVLLAANDPRYRFNLIVSPGQEINASVSDYMGLRAGDADHTGARAVPRDGARPGGLRRGVREGARARRVGRGAQGRAHRGERPVRGRRIRAPSPATTRPTRRSSSALASPASRRSIS